MPLIKERRQVIPSDAAAIAPTETVEECFADEQPGIAKAFDTVLGALKQDLVPGPVQEALFSALNPAVRRAMIAKEAGVDATILTTIKDQLRMVDAVLRRTFNEDGSIKTVGEEGVGMNPRDVLNLSLKVSQMMIRDLPKIYNVDRYQRTEAAVLATIQKHLNRDQQQTFITELENRSERL